LIETFDNAHLYILNLTFIIKSTPLYQIDTGSASISSTNNSNAIWRDPITIPEISPFEAAAFLESLHEGRSLFKGEWNCCWARLSVHWLVEDLLLEYASQVETHMNKILTIVHDNHCNNQLFNIFYSIQLVLISYFFLPYPDTGRTNPNILVGMRIAVFRKGATPSPTIVIGDVIDSCSTTGYSKLRVAFDTNQRVGMILLYSIYLSIYLF
jgi:hypothetical protein